MGAEEQTPNENSTQNGVDTETSQNTTSPPVAPEVEEPPKMEEIVTGEVLEKILNGYNPNLSLVSWHAELGTKAGDNYMSIMYALELVLRNKNDINGSTNKLKVMLKTLPRNIFRADMINEMKAFKVESALYTDILPLFLNVQKEKGIPKEHVFRAWPICYAAHLDGQTDFLAMEDLKVSGYNMGSRINGLDFNHCAIVLQNLAKYHAISFAKFNGDTEKIRETFPLLHRNTFGQESKMRDMQEQFFVQSYKNLAAALKNMGEELACSRLEKLADADVCTILSDLLSKDVEYGVITHGDCWVNNIMFKYSYDQDNVKTSYPVGAVFVDFQLCQASSRLVDVFYFLITSSKLGVLDEREEDLLMIYHSEFTSLAERLGVNTKERGLTWQNLLKEADRYRLFGIMSGLILAPMFAADAEDVPDMETMTKEDFENTNETMKKLFKDLCKGNTMQKVKNIALNQLPKCSGAAQFL